MKSAIITISVKYKLGELTIPLIKKYSEKIGSSFYVITKTLDSSVIASWDKLNLYHFLSKYDRVACIDADMIIQKNSENIFEHVPENMVGMRVDPVTSKKDKLLNIMRSFDNVYCDYILDKHELHIDRLTEYNKPYYNGGVIVFSRSSGFFPIPITKIDKKDGIDFYYEQTYLNWCIYHYNMPIYNIDDKFNCMSKTYSSNDERLKNAYFIHMIGLKNKEERMRSIIKDIIKT